mgnify:CR=1 FL=1
MNILIGVVIYIAGVFAAREMNRQIYLIDKYFKPAWLLWFFSWLSFIIDLISFLVKKNKFKFKKNWFTGKYWK